MRGMGNILKTTQTTCARIVRRSRSFDRREIRTPASAQDDNYTAKIVEYYRKLTKIIDMIRIRKATANIFTGLKYQRKKYKTVISIIEHLQKVLRRFCVMI